MLFRWRIKLISQCIPSRNRGSSLHHHSPFLHLFPQVSVIADRTIWAELSSESIDFNTEIPNTTPPVLTNLPQFGSASSTPTLPTVAAPAQPRRSRSSPPSSFDDTESTRLRSRGNEARSREALRDAEKELRSAIFERSREMPNTKQRVYQTATRLLRYVFRSPMQTKSIVILLSLSSDTLEIQQLRTEAEQLRRENLELSNNLTQAQDEYLRIHQDCVRMHTLMNAGLRGQ